MDVTEGDVPGQIRGLENPTWVRICMKKGAFNHTETVGVEGAFDC